MTVLNHHPALNRVVVTSKMLMLEEFCNMKCVGMFTFATISSVHSFLRKYLLYPVDFLQEEWQTVGVNEKLSTN